MWILNILPKILIFRHCVLNVFSYLLFRHHVCASAYGQFQSGGGISSRHFTAVCNGDEGGPLTVKENGRFVPWIKNFVAFMCINWFCLDTPWLEFSALRITISIRLELLLLAWLANLRLLKFSRQLLRWWIGSMRTRKEGAVLLGIATVRVTSSAVWRTPTCGD